MDILKMGLSDSEAEESRRINGKNIITPPPKTPWWRLYMDKFSDPVIRILIIAALISIVAGIVEGSIFEGIGIIAAVILSTGISFFNEYRAGKEFEILNKTGDDVPVKVVRNNSFRAIPKKEVVAGDVVILETGELVPADGEIISAVAMEIDESKLTGEAVPVLKAAEGAMESRENTYPYHMVMAGTYVAAGNGAARITAVGDKTDVAKTMRAASEEVEDKTPLTKQLEKLSRGVGIFGFVFAVMIFVSLILLGIINKELVMRPEQWNFAGILFITMAVVMRPVWNPVVSDIGELVFKKDWKRKQPSWITAFISAGTVFAVLVIGTTALGAIPAGYSEWLPSEAAKEMLGYFMVAVTIIVVAVPEGLPMSVTLSLAYSMRKMTAGNNLVRRMHACETIGAATVICTDKTGTLTMNKMQVAEANFTDTLIETAYLAVAVNSTANLEEKNGKTTVLGNPTEGALLLWLKSQGRDYHGIRNGFSVTGQEPFSSERKVMITAGSIGGKEMVFIKGAPEAVIEKSIISENEKKQVLEEITSYQKRGMRTIGFAFSEPGKETKTIEGFTWLGFAVISDPVREDVPAAVKMCQSAGIDVKVITGDNHLMAAEIGRQIGLLDKVSEKESAAVLTGPELEKMDDRALLGILPKLKIISRAKPMDKLRIVKMLKKQGEVVAVTGDGTNDAPALNYADVGLAMGRSGTAVAKEASDIILLDDSFTSIVNAVMWGRSLYKNIQRFIIFQLTINFAALLTAFIGPFIGVKLPFTVPQMLWINLIMDTFAALALATEPPDRKVMDEPPRKPGAFIITKEMAAEIVFYGTIFTGVMLLFLLDIRNGGDTAQTAHKLSFFFNVFVLMQFWNLFNARVYGTKASAFKGINGNRAFMAIAVVILVLQIIVIEFGGKIMRTVPLAPEEWLTAVAGTSLVVAAGEIKRYAARKNGK